MSLFKFGIFCDCQYADAEPDIYNNLETGFFGDRHYRLSLDKLKEAIGQFNQSEVGFVLHLGDLVDRESADYATVNEILDKSRSNIYKVLGNHEYKVANGDRMKAMEAIGLAEPYYSFSYQGFKFIILDSNEESPISLPRGSREREEMIEEFNQLRAEGVEQAYNWNGRISKAQLDWLEGELEAARNIGEKIIVCSHHPAYPSSTWNIVNDQDLLNLLDRYSITAYLNGHTHYHRYGLRNGVPYITFPGMVEKQSNAYSVAEVNDDSIIITGYGRHRDFRLDF